MVDAVKDEDREHPVADVWRPILRDVVKALAERDDERVPTLSAVSVRPGAAAQIRSYLDGYGEPLTELPDEAWASSRAQWLGPEYATQWDVFVDLWTAESGQSDMVLQVRVVEDRDGFRFEIETVYVP